MNSTTGMSQTDLGNLIQGIITALNQGDNNQQGGNNRDGGRNGGGNNRDNTRCLRRNCNNVLT